MKTRTVAGIAMAAALASYEAQPLHADEVPAAPVILVHGWHPAPGAMDEMQAAFASAGYATYVATLPGENNVINAIAVAALVSKAKSETGAAKVHLVSHSMGGLSTRYYIKRLGGAAHVQTYVAFGTPQYGYDMACALGPEEGGQMCPFSSFLRDLNAGDDTPDRVAYSTFRSSEDTPNTTRLDGGACFLEIPGVKHSEEPKSPAFIRAVLDAVRGTCPGTYIQLPIE